MKASRGIHVGTGHGHTGRVLAAGGRLHVHQECGDDGVGHAGHRGAHDAEQLHRGLVANGSLYAACFYGLTAFHALHVVVGLGGLASLWPRAARGAFSAREHTAVASWTAYWHFVGAVWVIFFATVYW